MESEILQLMDMVLHIIIFNTPTTHFALPQGATAAQARAALRRYNDVMEAAARIFDGAFDDLPAEGGATSVPSARPSGQRERCYPPMRLAVCHLPHTLSSGSYSIIDSRRRRRLRGISRKWRRRH
jgi:hypothetical protein